MCNGNANRPYYRLGNAEQPILGKKTFETMPAQPSSTAQDLARKKYTEIDQPNGYVVRQGEAKGIATPVNRTLYTVVKVRESCFESLRIL